MISYKQQEPGKLVLFALLYLGLFLFVVLGVIGADAGSDFVNQGVKKAGDAFFFLVALVVFAPFLLGLWFLKRQVNVSVGADSITVQPKNKKPFDIPLSSIASLIVKGPPINGIQLYDAVGKKLHAFVMENDESTAAQLLSEILAVKPMRLTKEVPIFNGKAVEKAYVAE